MLFLGFSDLGWFLGGLGRLLLASQDGVVSQDNPRVWRFAEFCLTLLTWDLAGLGTLISRVSHLVSFGVFICRCLLGVCLTLGLLLVARLVSLILKSLLDLQMSSLCLLDFSVLVSVCA